jgi:hypothetical protein
VRQINHRSLMPKQKKLASKQALFRSNLAVLIGRYQDLGASVGQPLLQVCKPDLASLGHHDSVHHAARNHPYKAGHDLGRHNVQASFNFFSGDWSP